MQRVPVQPRPNWRQRVESQGLHFHTNGPETYWDESVYYLFTGRQVDELEVATYRLNEMCLAAVEHVLTEKRFEEFLIPEKWAQFLAASWERDEHTVYGRFDLAYDGSRPPVLLEFNADTPTALLEAAVIQWFWFQDLAQSQIGIGHDQFNSLHERLIEAWSAFRNNQDLFIHLASVGLEQSVEDFVTVQYLRDTAMQAGWKTEVIDVADIGWDAQRRCFMDLQNRAIRNLFKLYPWEWLIRERFGELIPVAQMKWFEPPWKMILSNKALLAVLYELFPDSPYLLPAAFEPLGSTYVKKPILSREGANISIVHEDKIMLATEGEYGEGPFVYQEFRPLPNHDGNYVVVGSWMVNGYACGIGLREDSQLITTNTSRFVPHLFRR